MMKLKLVALVLMLVPGSFITNLAAQAATSGNSYTALLSQRPLAFEPVVSHPGADDVYVSRAAGYDVVVTGAAVRQPANAAPGCKARCDVSGAVAGSTATAHP